MSIKRLAIFSLLLVFASTCSVPERASYSSLVDGNQKARNVILMIGDGMGLSQISYAFYQNKRQLALQSFPVVGFQKTTSYDDLVTDSAAGATAFSCGVKTYRGAIGLNPDSTACKTIVEEANENGLATGLVATSTIVHATPAAFFAHEKYRVQNEAIATHMVNADLDLVIGGGKKYFADRESDERNLLDELKQKGYQINDYSTIPLTELTYSVNRNLIYFTASGHAMSATAGRKYLPVASRIAANFLDRHSQNGFFLMIEGSQIDWAGHSNDPDWMLDESLDFNQAIEEVLNFARKRDDTLVIVTADHETGGFALDKAEDPDANEVHYTTSNHTGTLIPVFAYGPGAHLFSGIYDNTQIHAKMREALGLDDASASASY